MRKSSTHRSSRTESRKIRKNVKVDATQTDRRLVLIVDDRVGATENGIPWVCLVHQTHSVKCRKGLQNTLQKVGYHLVNKYKLLMYIKHLASYADKQNNHYDLCELNAFYGRDQEFNFFKYEVFIAYDECGIMGFGCVGEKDDEYYLRYDLVRPDCRGLKIQDKLIKARIDFLRRLNVKEIVACAAPENLYSLNNLVDNGFRFCNSQLVTIKGKTYQKLKLKL